MNEPIDQPMINSMASENGPNVDETTSEIQAVDNVVPTRSRLGLLDLPSELRLNIYRHLLVSPRKKIFVRGPKYPYRRPEVAILRTSRLIYREAFDVFYGENVFTNSSKSHHADFLPRHPRVRDAIQNFDINVRVPGWYQLSGLMDHFAHTSVLRGTLTVRFTVPYPLDVSLAWFISSLDQFIHFRTVELYFKHSSGVREHTSRVLEYLISASVPTFGPAEDCSCEGRGVLRFHPVDHCFRQMRGIRQTFGWMRLE